MFHNNFFLQNLLDIRILTQKRENVADFSIKLLGIVISN